MHYVNIWCAHTSAQISASSFMHVHHTTHYTQTHTTITTHRETNITHTHEGPGSLFLGETSPGIGSWRERKPKVWLCVLTKNWSCGLETIGWEVDGC